MIILLYNQGYYPYTRKVNNLGSYRLITLRQMEVYWLNLAFYLLYYPPKNESVHSSFNLHPTFTSNQNGFLLAND